MKYIKKINWSVLSMCFLIAGLALSSIGCGGTMGETSAERGRRWKSILRTNMAQINDDIDTILLMDKRSKLTDKYVRD